MYHRIKYYPLCLILGFSVATVRRFIELWDVHLGFGVAVAQSYVFIVFSNLNPIHHIFWWIYWHLLGFPFHSVTTGLFGFFLLIVYGRLGKVSKLFKKRYPCCIPICNVRDKICCRTPDEADTEDSSKVSTITSPKPVSPPAIQMVPVTTGIQPQQSRESEPGTTDRSTEITPLPPNLDMMSSAGTNSLMESPTVKNMVFAMGTGPTDVSPIETLDEIVDETKLAPANSSMETLSDAPDPQM